MTFVKLTYQFRPYQIARGATTATRGTTSSAVRGTPQSVPSRCTPCCWATNKDKVTKSTSPLVSYNSTHATDIVEPGGGPGGSDRLFEAKVVSPCTLAERQGAVTRGQKPSKRGYLFGFGNTTVLRALGGRRLDAQSRVLPRTRPRAGGVHWGGSHLSIYLSIYLSRNPSPDACPTKNRPTHTQKHTQSR